MSAIPRLKQDRWHVACGVCRRRADGLGYAPPVGRPVLWLCDDPACLKLGKTVFHMPEPVLDAYEARARDEAGQDAGGYLDELGVTDLEKLRPEEWRVFLDKVILGFETSLRRQLTEGAAPF